MNCHACTSRLSRDDFALKKTVYLSSVHIRYLMVLPVGDICAAKSRLLVWRYSLDAMNIDARLLIQRDVMTGNHHAGLLLSRANT
jgi:hypothetical protein